MIGLAEVIHAAQTSFADGAQKPMGVDARELVSDAGGELIDCCHGFFVRGGSVGRKGFLRIFCVEGGGGRLKREVRGVCVMWGRGRKEIGGLDEVNRANEDPFTKRKGNGCQRYY